MASIRTIIAAIALSVVFLCFPNRGTAGIVLPKVDTIFRCRHKAAALLVDLMVSVRLSIFVYVIRCHVGVPFEEERALT